MRLGLAGRAGLDAAICNTHESRLDGFGKVRVGSPDDP